MGGDPLKANAFPKHGTGLKFRKTVEDWAPEHVAFNIACVAEKLIHPNENVLLVLRGWSHSPGVLGDYWGDSGIALAMIVDS